MKLFSRFMNSVWQLIMSFEERSITERYIPECLRCLKTMYSFFTEVNFEGLNVLP